MSVGLLCNDGDVTSLFTPILDTLTFEILKECFEICPRTFLLSPRGFGLNIVIICFTKYLVRKVV